MINLGKVKETTSNGTGRRYIAPGIRDVEVLGFESMTANNGNPVIKGTLVDYNTDEQHEEMFPATTIVSPGKQKSAFDISLIKIRHIARACISMEELEGMPDCADIDEFVETLNSYLVGKRYRQKFTGEEKKAQQSGNIYAVARIPLPTSNDPMAENINVSIERSSLSFDKSNIRDYKPFVEPTLGSIAPRPTLNGINQG